MSPPPDVLAGTIEDELASLDQKIQSGGASPADVQRYNDLLQMLQDQERKKPKNDFLKPRFRLNGHGQFQQGFGMTMNTPLAQSDACGEFKNIYYNCADLPWDSTDGWTRTDDIGAVTVRDCTPDDACVSDGVMGIDSNDGLLFWRMEEGLLTERYASAAFRMKQTISERNPSPDTTLFGGGIVWVDDGVKSTAVGFAEDLNGDKLVLMPIDGHPDPETGELGITEVLLAYFDWSAWHDYRLVKDTEGMIELFADGDPTPVVSYPYASLNMGSLGGPVILFGNLIEGQVARVLFELDYLNYSVGMPDTVGLTSVDGKMRLLSIFGQNPDFNPEYEPNKLVARVAITPVEGMASNTQSHKFYLRTERTIRDSSGAAVGLAANDIQIGPLENGVNPKEIVVDAASLWDGRDSTGNLLPEGVYGYETALSVLREDKKGKVKVLSTDPVSCYASLTAGVGTFRAGTQVEIPRFYSTFDSVPTLNTDYIYKLSGCSVGSDPVIDVFFDAVAIDGVRRYKQVESNDDADVWACTRWVCYSQKGAYLVVRPSTTEKMRVIVRAKSSSLGGSCTLSRKVGTGSWTNTTVSFSSARLNWGWDAGDAIQTVLLKENQDTLLILASPGTFKPVKTNAYASFSVAAFDDDDGVGLGSTAKASSTLSPGFVYIGMMPGAPTGRINVYRNDVYRDTDGDGLGDDLEDGTYGLMTCKDASGWNRLRTFDCRNALAGGKDTDADGLDDNWEVLGKDWPNFPQHLPAWGADPLRRDVFFEIDRVNAPDVAVFTEAELAKIAQKYRDPNSTIVNPDGTRGIGAHFDIGASCSNPSLCGKWGGSNLLDANCCNKPTPTCEDHCGPYTTEFSDGRKGLFHYVVGNTGTGGQNVGSNADRTLDRLSIGLSPGRNWRTFLHESGHNLGLPDGKLVSAGYFNCSPHYTSLMNYAYQGQFDGSPENVHFSDGQYANVVLNPNGLCESDGLMDVNGTQFDPSFLARAPFRFVTAGFGVDWNRDGVVTDCSRPVKASINYLPFAACDLRRYRQNEEMFGGTTSNANPVLGTFNGDLYFHYVKSNRVRQSRFLGFANCQVGQGQNGYPPCDQWETPSSISSGNVYSAPAVAEFEVNGAKALHMVFRGSSNKLRYKKMDVYGNWGSDIDLGVSSVKTPSLARYRGKLFLMYVDTSNNYLYQMEMDQGGMWSEPAPSLDEQGFVMPSAIAPALAVRPLVQWYDFSVLHLAFTLYGDDEKNIVMRRFNENTKRWHLGVDFGLGATNPDVWEGYHAADGQVGFSWLNDPILPFGGRFYIMYRGTDDNVYFDYMTGAGAQPGTWKFRMNGYEDNAYTDIDFGVTLVAFNVDDGTDSNLVAAFTNKLTDKTQRTMRFLPYATGIYSLEHRDFNDWTVVEKGLCRSLLWIPNRMCAGDSSCVDRYCGLMP